MKNKLYFISTVIIILIIIVAVVSVIKINNLKGNDINFDIKKYSGMWEIYDANLNAIKTSMDKITESNDNFYWWKLKDFSIEDKDYESILNSLVSDIRMCYIEYTDDGSMYTDSNPIRKYRGKDKITKKELTDLQWRMSTENCRVGTFDTYSNLLISNDSNRRELLLSKIDEIVNLNSISGTRFVDDNYSYEALLSYKVIETSLLSKLSYWLEIEYSNLKN